MGGREPFALQTTLHVGDPYDHRVDVVTSDERRQQLSGESWRVVVQSFPPMCARPSEPGLDGFQLLLSALNL